MSGLQTVKDLIPGLSEEGVETHTFECQDCFERFESAKDARRVQCPDCLSNRVEQVENNSISDV
jgi:DNA-directed RNA polymerase subunit RPC12/RpoP